MPSIPSSHGAAERRPSVPELIALPGHKAHQEQELATGGRQQRRWARWAVQMWTVRQASKQASKQHRLAAVAAAMAAHTHVESVCLVNSECC